jgi:hypothetical protein
MSTVEREPTENRTVDRPGPAVRRGHRQSERAEREDSESPKHKSLLVASFEN